MSEDILLKARTVEKERFTAEKCLPGYMWNLVLQSLQRRGVEIREDMLVLSERASSRDLKGLDPFTVGKIAKKVEHEGYAILSAGSDNPVSLAFGLSRMCISLSGNGWPLTENVLLLSAAFNEDFKEDPSEYGGEQHIEMVAGKMHNEAVARGWFRLQSIAGKGAKPAVPLDDEE